MNYFERKPQEIAIFRALQLGDLLVSVPALRALRFANPEAIVTLIGLPWARAFVSRFSMYLDDWIEFPGYPGLPEREPDMAAVPSFFAEVQQRRFDLAIQMQGSGRISNGILAGFRAKISAGFHPVGNVTVSPSSFLPYPEDLPEPLRLLRLMEHLGIPAQGTYLEFPILQDEWQAYEQMVRAENLRPGEYICIHPGARAEERRWPVERFAIVADRLSDQGWPIVITGSPEEVPLAAEMVGAMKRAPINLTGRTDLGVAAAWISQARLLICNDTGVSHIAAALNVPSVVLFSASDPLRWGPLNRKLHQVVTNAGAVPASNVIERAEKILSDQRMAPQSKSIQPKPAVFVQSSD
ncbi:MAG TPA: glycosyltransferase family 9 protein [Anaerolineaceae bacterium]|nr:glycosyltransferase family 9 protein [Anaerolineaceae bacterium]